MRTTTRTTHLVVNFLDFHRLSPAIIIEELGQDWLLVFLEPLEKETNVSSTAHAARQVELVLDDDGKLLPRGRYDA